MSPLSIILLLVGLVAGGAVGYVLRQKLAAGKIGSAETKAEHIVAEAAKKAQQAALDATDKALKIVEDGKREAAARRNEVLETQQRLEKREALFDQKLMEFQDKVTKLQEKAAAVEADRAAISTLKEEQIEKLQAIAGLTREQAIERITALVEESQKEEIVSRIRKLEQVTADELDVKAKNILATTIQRLASSHAVDTTTTAVQLPADDMKGRIIGKEGRNIKAIENLTGCELIVDDTPGIITISGFSPVRRQIAKRALDKLLADGRIHPGRIEEAVDEAKKELNNDMKKAGEEALYALGITGVDPKLIQILGRLKFRTSYGQNALLHSMEVAQLATLMAEELGADITVCKKGGLFHDIGKAVDHDIQGSHPEIGYNIMKKFGFSEELCYQSIGHHEDKPKTLEAVIVKAADAISGARPGARKDTLAEYVRRLEELENVATSFPGVEKAYAIQAGRDLRVFVSPKAVDDFAAYKLAKEIASKIEADLKYPGEIRVTVIRETRVIETAR
ncbi:ribonuclease Y [Patescibacteria group bacterium]|nr:MAG: ribonuclease Y [Patescibacteria group bacterium]